MEQKHRNFHQDLPFIITHHQKQNIWQNISKVYIYIYRASGDKNPWLQLSQVIKWT